MTTKVLVLNPYMPTLGGGEKHMGYLCKYIEDYYNDVQIDILVHNYNNVDIHASDYITIEDVKRRFDLTLTKTSLLKIDLKHPNSLKEHFYNKKKIEDISARYDLFINFMYQSKHIGKAKKNIYSCMFPAKKYAFKEWPKRLAGMVLDYKYKQSYDCFMTNSSFTNHWQQYIWKTGKRNKIVYPPVFSEETLKSRKWGDKKNIILSVGRFFVGAHNKKQNELVDIFIRNAEKFPGWEFHLAGALSNYEDDLKYVEIIQNKIKGYPIYLHLNTPFSKLEELYYSAKIFWHATGYQEQDNLFPEKMEHFGITTVEAMSYGVIPVVINKGGQPEIVQEGKSGFLWDSEEECIRKTLNLVNNDDYRQSLTEQTFERSKKFSIEEFYSRTREVLDGL
ncbi:glycosyltransferase [Paenibacillus gansuensis]|uniref:Glycosyltransferase n=1 Tax=Paenibacillus gansuensis TaxID=306542 RepID=A0ABW5PFZ3_9BACL